MRFSVHLLTRDLGPFTYYVITEGRGVAVGTLGAINSYNDREILRQARREQSGVKMPIL